MTALEIEEALVELIRVNSTSIPDDVVRALTIARDNESSGTPAREFLDTILVNAESAKTHVRPICQDMGYPIFYVEESKEHSSYNIKKLICGAVEIATIKSFLRPSCIDTLRGTLVPGNVLETMPTIHVTPHLESPLIVGVLQKGGGGENVSRQYSLPFPSLAARRTFEGVYRVVMDAIVKAEGKGCAPGVLGVCIGGDREIGYHIAKKQLFRALDDRNIHGELDELEQRIEHDANALGIGPMGLGGKTTLLGVKIATAPRLHSSFFVTIAYSCWALRRRTLRITGGGIDIT